ncbi:hypothetical protein [Robertmurraya sp. FSL R5-0851]|uniref:hypothetical protein n=1 Tax=Robertmurraya sp. FSL R5-0851 TaxID=2921584 RepID=UPI0030FA5D46
MNRLYLVGISLILLVSLFGCSSNSHTVESNEDNEVIVNKPANKDSTIKPSEKEYVEELADTTHEGVSKEEMEQLKEKLRTYIFVEYMGSSDYVYAKGVNWTENYYDNLTAEEIWNVIEEYKKMNNGEEGTLFDQASYLSVNAPIKDNWEELFLENWENSSYAEDNQIETMIDKGDSVWIYTDNMPYTGEEDNYPFITLFKRTGNWHG